MVNAEVDALLFGVEKSMRYHQRRRGFFELCHRAVMFGVVASSSAVVVNLGSLWAGLVSAILAAFDLAVGFGTRARDHQVLYQRFADLNRRIRKAGDEPSPEQISSWRDERLAIELDEPPILWALEADCYNEVARAWGRELEQPNVLRPWHRLLIHVWSFETSDFSDRPKPLPG